jgi:hypothetical protein
MAPRAPFRSTPALLEVPAFSSSLDDTAGMDAIM